MDYSGTGTPFYGDPNFMQAQYGYNYYNPVQPIGWGAVQQQNNAAFMSPTPSITPQDEVNILNHMGSDSFIITKEEIAQSRCDHKDATGKWLAQVDVANKNYYCPRCKRYFKLMENRDQVDQAIKDLEATVETIKLLNPGYPSKDIILGLCDASVVLKKNLTKSFDMVSDGWGKLIGNMSNSFAPGVPAGYGYNPNNILDQLRSQGNYGYNYSYANPGYPYAAQPAYPYANPAYAGYPQQPAQTMMPQAPAPTMPNAVPMGVNPFDINSTMAYTGYQQPAVVPLQPVAASVPGVQNVLQNPVIPQQTVPVGTAPAPATVAQPQTNATTAPTT